MTNEKDVNRSQVAGFLLGLGIGLVVGLLFKADYPRALPRGSAPVRRNTE